MSLFLAILSYIGIITISLFYFGSTIFCAILITPFVIFLLIIIFIFYMIKLQYKKPEVFINLSVSEDNTNQNYGGDEDG